ncbi:uncharacterized protein LOC102376686 isoform X2 [Alligator sinensis]|uniref:Uncharacterized protein LOC102376686 isoform X2 n=1 Tax=Alligator sinensis TaxID=38654 RepID=A0A1U7RXP5_ALLSI|nr:uncharacterized protein LOC102376686 isoform X2 [Alligator sinensis]
MNTAPASESGPYSTNHTRPFFYAQPTAQQPFPNPWYLSQVYNPYCMPAPGFRNGNPYFPFYSVALHEYPGYFVPQHPMHTRVNRRPYFNAPPPSPMFYHATRFRHYSSPGRRTETKETQTDPRQPENKAKKHQAPRIETKGCDAGNMACVSSGIGTETDSTSEKQDSSGSSIVPEREFHKSPSSTAQYRNLPSGSYAFEKEEVRIEYGNGSPAIQLWKSFKETIPLYDVASGKPVPENIVQRDLFSVSSCEGLIYGPHEAEALMPSTYSDECKALPSKQSIDVQEREVQNNEAKLEVEKLGNASQKAKSPQGEARAVQITDLASSICNDQSVARQDTLIISKISSSSKRSTGSKASQDESSLTQQAVLFPSNMEITNDMFLQQKKLNQSHSVTSGSQMTLDKSLWCDESVEKFVPSNSWLAGLDNMDTNCNYDMRFPQRKHQNVLSVSSDEMSSKEEGSSIDNAPVSYFVPDSVLQKSMYTLQKNTDDLEKDKIKSSGSLNEDEEQVDGEQTNDGNNQNFKSCSNLKIKDLSSRGKKMGSLPRSSSKKKIYSLKKKAVKSLSLSEVDDSEEFSVVEDEEEEDEDDLDEIEYFFHGATPYEMLTPSKGSFYHQIGQRMLWKPPKNSLPAQLISWPAREKVKLKSALGEIGLFCKPKEKDQDEVVYSDYGYYERKRPAAKREGLLKEGSDHKRPPQKRSGGRLLKENVGLAVEDYWIRSGAKPKLASLIRSSLSPPAKIKEQGRGTKRAVYRRR